MNKITGLIISKWCNLNIRFKLIATFILTALSVFMLNALIYINVNHMVEKIDKVYISNVNLNQMLDALTNIQDSMTEYLDTKNSQALQNYYYEEEIYRKLIKDLNEKIVDNELLIIEKNIKNISETYLKNTSDTISAKRARNIRKYNECYERSTEMFEYIKTYIYSLNNEYLRKNSINYQFFLKSLNYIELIGGIMLIIVMIFNISIIYIATYSITNPLTLLARVANEIAGGNFDINLIKIDTLDEVGAVAKAFNHMILSIKKYIEEIKNKLEIESIFKEEQLVMTNHLKDVELKYLQAQINPHFLFNTLNAAVQLAMLEEAERTGVFVENVAEFFRYNIRKIDKDTTLREEIRLVDHYIYIINVRFDGEIIFKKIIDDHLLDIRVPSMILQPIVENAINHGIRNIEWEGIIKLSVYEEEERINISIKDNGVGMEEAEITDIMNKKFKETSEFNYSNGIGLINVIDRLGIYYGIDNGLEIISKGKNEGVQVLIHIPKSH